MFSDKAMVFCNEEFIGGPGEFLKWAEQEHNYENFRPKPLYETLAEEAYKNHLNSNKVKAIAVFYNHKFFQLITLFFNTLGFKDTADKV